MINYLREGVRISGDLYRSNLRHAPAGGFALVPLWVRWLHLSIAGPLFGLYQWYGCVAWDQWGWPEWPLGPICAAHDAIGTWLDRRAAWYDWHPPDENDPQAVGFHTLQGGGFTCESMRVSSYDGPGIYLPEEREQ